MKLFLYYFDENEEKDKRFIYWQVNDKSSPGKIRLRKN